MMGWADVITRTRLHAILDRYADLTMGVIGDLALDVYWYADMTRSHLSRETPRFPRPVIREEFSPGGGANVAHNLAQLGVGAVVALSVVGEDWRGERLAAVLAECGVKLDRLIASPQRSTTAYIKPLLQGYDSQQEDARLDFENAAPLPPDLEDALIEVLTAHLGDLDGCLVADQLEVNGIVTPRVRDGLNHLAAQPGGPVFVVDSRQRIGLFRQMVLKPNRMEAVRAGADWDAVPPDELSAIARQLCTQAGRPVFVTLSEDGVLACTAEAQRTLPAAPVRPPLDIVGAGDAFSAALGASLAAGASPWEAGAIANLAAAVVIEKLNQTGTATPGEVLARYDLALEAEAP